jgi:hypothetical protein
MIGNTLPPIGRSGLVNSVKRLSGGELPGWRDVDPDAEFMAGMVACLKTDSNGKVVVTKVTVPASQKAIGLFYCHKSTYFYVPVVDEVADFTDTVHPNIVYIKPYVATGSFIMHNSSTGAIIPTSSGAAWTLDTTNGVLTRVGTTTVPNSVLVSYRYRDPNHSGIDTTLSGKVTVLEGPADLATLVYDSAAAWVLNADVKVNSDGLLTVTSAGTEVVGMVTKAPSSDDPELHVRLKI